MLIKNYFKFYNILSPEKYSDDKNFRFNQLENEW